MYSYSTRASVTSLIGNYLGLTITVATIWLIPFLEVALGWRWAFAVLALGPTLGIMAMWRLKSLPEATHIAGGKG
jgi:hypothetical protein